MSAIRIRPRETEGLDDLRSALRGELLLPASVAYDTGRRIWNGAIDRRPAGIARCTGVADVVATVRFARERDLLVAVRSEWSRGRRSRALRRRPRSRPLNEGIRVDPARTARQAGVLWGELDRETQLFGLATVGGIVSHTGVPGLTLGSGIGWLMRKYGATVDNLLSVDLVTADGELVTASENENLICSGACAAAAATSASSCPSSTACIRSARWCSPGRSSTRSKTRRTCCGSSRACGCRARRAHDDRRARARATTAVPARRRARQADSHGRRLLRRGA